MTGRTSRWHHNTWAALWLALALALGTPGVACSQTAPAAAVESPVMADSAKADSAKATTASGRETVTAPESAASSAERLAMELAKLRQLSSVSAPSRVGISLAVIALMGSLFFVVFYWQHRIEQSDFFSYFSTDAPKHVVVNRLSAPTLEKWDRGDYLNEIFLARSERGRNWVDLIKPRPTFDATLKDTAVGLGLGWEIDAIERRLWTALVQREGGGTNPFGSSARPSGLGGLGGSGIGRDDAGKNPEELKKAKEDREKVKEELSRFDGDVRDWDRLAYAQALDWRRVDLAAVEKLAGDRAAKLLNVDFSALRGRGPQFVLEFTAVVVIIFSAVILGVLGVLDSNQIGTLLAAIAGYVLGKSAGRGQGSSPSENVSVRASADDGVK